MKRKVETKMRECVFDRFTNSYKISKTLRNELVPIGKTKENIIKAGLLDEDEKRADDYQQVKKLADAFYKTFNSRVLKSLRFSVVHYYELYMNSNKTEKEKEEQITEAQKMRNIIAKAFSSDEEFKLLFKKEMITEKLKSFAQSEVEKKAVKEFAAFTTYFTGYFENRLNMYSNEEKNTAIACRIINQNLPKYIDNIRVFHTISGNSTIMEQMETLNEELAEIVEPNKVEDFFNIERYSEFICNEDIVRYNAVLGGYTKENGTKIQGINEIINLYNQQHGKEENFRRLPKMKGLYKQILADTESVSFIEKPFDNDREVLETIAEVVSVIKEQALDINAKYSIKRIIGDIAKYNLNEIFLKNGISISDISNSLFGSWSVIRQGLEGRYDANNNTKKKNEKYVSNRQKSINSDKSYSIGEINECIRLYCGVENGVEQYFVSFYNKEKKDYIERFQEAYAAANHLLTSNYESKYGLASDKKNVAIIKELLDSIKVIETFIKPLLGEGTEPCKDELFYGEFIPSYDIISTIIPLYNKVRNYVTRKPYSTEKIKLNFGKPTLLAGWDKSKERDNLSVIFRKDNNYYLGIMNRNSNNLFLDIDISDEADVYEKMEYKLLPGPNKMLPKVFFAKSNADLYAPSEEIIENYTKGTHKKNEKNFDLKKCHALIDYFKECIRKNPEWDVFNFKFSDTSTYSDISQFYNEVERQGYSIKFKNVSAKYIDGLVEEGKLYLFKIYNKDFSEFSKGKPNLHTVYFKMLFDERNMRDVVYKLNGEAEVFYRKASIAEVNQVTHKKNEPIQNKNPHVQISKGTSTFDYDITKDRRYTVDKFQFHLPITMNFGVKDNTSINERVYDTIRANKDLFVIGIDRGERHLLYLSVIDSSGRVVEQKTLNLIEDEKTKYIQDYHSLLDLKEKNQEKERKNWSEIESIKELKEGYLSQAIHVITKLMIKYNAIVVLEDLNFGFINGRKKVGKSVYQQFERMLINKLNYLIVDKTEMPDVPGGALHAFQLSNPFVSFQKLGKQSGFLFYIPAWNTSKIDPTTGFVNLLNPKYTSSEDAKAFFGKFDEIKYVGGEKEYFEFLFNYKKFTEKAEGTKLEWTICSYGDRIMNYRNPEQNNAWDSKIVDVTSELIKLFTDYGIDYKAGNLVSAICKQTEKNFFVKLIKNLQLILQMRNSITGTDVDYLISPVKNADGYFYDSRNSKTYLPDNADANGAYNIARKGLWALERIRESDKYRINLAISNKEWLAYAQAHTVR